MTASPELIAELRASRPVAPATLRARTRKLTASSAPERSVLLPRLPRRRLALALVGGAAALAVASAGIVGLTRPGAGGNVAVPRSSVDAEGKTGAATRTSPNAFPQAVHGGYGSAASGAAGLTPAPSPGAGRAQRVTGTLTVEVSSSDGVARASQDALDLVRSLGGYVVDSSVVTGDSARATLTVRVPVEKVQDAIAGLSALGRLTSQQVTIDDLQESLDAWSRRAASVRAQILTITARLGSETLDAQTRAALEARRRTLQSELRTLRRSIASTSAEARLATLELTVATPQSLGVVPTRSRLDRTLDGALNALVWEGIVALAVLVVVTPLALVALTAWFGRRAYRRREAERILAT